MYPITLGRTSGPSESFSVLTLAELSTARLGLSGGVGLRPTFPQPPCRHAKESRIDSRTISSSLFSIGTPIQIGFYFL